MSFSISPAQFSGLLAPDSPNYSQVKQIIADVLPSQAQNLDEAKIYYATSLEEGNQDYTDFYRSWTTQEEALGTDLHQYDPPDPIKGSYQAFFVLAPHVQPPQQIEDEFIVGKDNEDVSSGDVHRGSFRKHPDGTYITALSVEPPPPLPEP